MKIFGTRMSLIGDIIMSLPVLQKLHSISYDPYVVFSIAQKCKQIAPLFENHPLINEIKISDGLEDLGENDKKIIDTCDIVLPVRPNQPEPFWYNKYNLIEQTTIMAGFKPEFTKNILPILYINRTIHKETSPTIAIWPFAGYGKNLHRSPSAVWWNKLIEIISKKNIKVHHYGAENEPNLSDNPAYNKFTNLSFSEQIYKTLKCDMAIGTDSGSMWVIGAYHHIPQINLITNHSYNHFTNKLALAPVGSKCFNLYADEKCDNIEISHVIATIENNLFK